MLQFSEIKFQPKDIYILTIQVLLLFGELLGFKMETKIVLQSSITNIFNCTIYLKKMEFKTATYKLNVSFTSTWKTGLISNGNIIHTSCLVAYALKF